MFEGTYYAAYGGESGLLTISTSTNGITWNLKETISSTYANTSTLAQPSLTTDGNNLYLVYNDANGTLAYGQSNDGNTWTNFSNQILEGGFPSLNNIQGSPTATWFNGELYVAYSNAIDGQIYSTSSLSIDGFTGWTVPTPLITSPSKENYSLTTFNNKFYFAWADKDSGVIYLINSTDGINWTTPTSTFYKGTQLLTTSGPVLTNSSGHLYLAYNNVDNSTINILEEDNPTGIWTQQATYPTASSTSDSFSSFSAINNNFYLGSLNAANDTSLLITTAQPNITPTPQQLANFGGNTAPSITAYNGEYYAVFQTGSTGAVGLSKSLDSINWTSLGSLSGAGSLNVTPTLTVYDGQLVMIYPDSQSGALIYRTSTNGASWTYSTITTSNGQTPTTNLAPSITVFNGKVYIAYKDSNNNINLLSGYSGNWTNSGNLGIGTSLKSPSLTTFNNNLYLAWADNNNIINLSSSNDGLNWTTATRNFGSYGQLETLSSPLLTTSSNNLYLGYATLSNTVNVLQNNSGIWSYETTLTPDSFSNSYSFSAIINNFYLGSLDATEKTSLLVTSPPISSTSSTTTTSQQLPNTISVNLTNANLTAGTIDNTFGGNTAPSITSYKGTYYAAYTSGSGVLTISTSTDGITWNLKGTITSSYLGTSSNNQPSLVTDGTALYLVYNNNTDNTLSYAISNDGNTWTDFGNSELLFSSSGFPTLKIQGSPTATWFNGKLYVAFTSATNGQIYLTSFASFDEFTGWTVPSPLSYVTAQGDVSLASFNNNLYLAWRDDNGFLNLSSSTDGINWTNNGNIGTQNNGAINSNFSPILTATSSGLYLTYQDPNTSAVKVLENSAPVNGVLTTSWTTQAAYTVENNGSYSLYADSQNLYLGYIDSTTTQGNLLTTPQQSTPLATGSLLNSTGTAPQAHSLGDINGDGYDDLVLYAEGQNQAYVVFGNAQSNLPNLTQLHGTNGFVINGSKITEVVNAGDVNRDGINDYYIVEQSGNNSGSVYLLDGSETNSGSVSVQSGKLIYSNNNIFIPGSLTVTGGDLNGDGLIDTVVGYAAPIANANFSFYNSGVDITWAVKATIIYGDTSKPNQSIFFDSFTAPINTSTPVNLNLSLQGDINGDGYNDLVASVPQIPGNSTGQIYVVLGVTEPATPPSVNIVDSNIPPLSSGTVALGKLWVSWSDSNNLLHLGYYTPPDKTNHPTWIFTDLGTVADDEVSWNVAQSADGASLAEFNNKLYVFWADAKVKDPENVLKYTTYNSDFTQNGTQRVNSNGAFVSSTDRPNVTANSGELYLTWQDNSSDHRAYYSSLGLGGTFDSVQRIGGNVDALFNPAMALASDGNLFAVWRDPNNFYNYEVAYLNQQGSWSTSQQVYSNDITIDVSPNLAPYLLALGDTLYLFWNNSINLQGLYIKISDLKTQINTQWLPLQLPYIPLGTNVSPSVFIKNENGQQVFYFINPTTNTSEPLYYTNSPNTDVLSQAPYQIGQIQGLNNSLSGSSLSLGDINGDGYQDMITNTPGDPAQQVAFGIFGNGFLPSQTNYGGTTGDNTIVGTPTGENIVAGPGDDNITTNGGADVVYAGAGNDILIISDTKIKRLDGGSGFDTLKWAGPVNSTLDLTQVVNGIPLYSRINGIEAIDLSSYGSNTLVVGKTALINLSDESKIRVITGDATDKVVYDGNPIISTIPNSYTQLIYTNPTTGDLELLISIDPDIQIAPQGSQVNSTITPAVATSIAASITPLQAYTAATTTSLTNNNAVIDYGPAKLFISPASAAQQDTQVSFTISRTGDPNKTLIARYHTENNTAIGGTHYNPSGGVLVLAPGEIYKTIEVPLPPVNSLVRTGDRQFNLKLSIEEETVSTPVKSVNFNLASGGSEIRNLNDTKFTSTEVTPPGTISPLGKVKFEAIVDATGKATLTVNINGSEPINTFYIQNSQNQWERFTFDGTNGAQFITNAQGDRQLKLSLTDGLRGDSDGLNNGFVSVVGALGNTPNINYINDLGTLGGVSSLGKAINSSGQVVGSSPLANGANHAFFYSDTNNNQKLDVVERKDLGTLGGNYSYANAIDENGHVVGYSAINNNAKIQHAFIQAENNSQSDLGTLGGIRSVATAIKNNKVVGYSTTANGQTHAFVFTDNNGNGQKDDGENLVDLATAIKPITGTYSQATGINSAGYIVGSTNANGSNNQAFYWDELTGMQVLGTLAGGNSSQATGINDQNKVIGYSTLTNGNTHGFLWNNNSGLQDLGTLGGHYSKALGINNQGQIVGSSLINGNTDSHAFLWQNGEMIDLNSLLSPSLGWQLTEATGINDAGQIVGNGIINGQQHSFLLSLIV